MGTILGIDLGTTKSAAAIWRDGHPEIVRNAEGEHITPSIVAVDPESGQWVVGTRAKQIGLSNPHAAIYSVKRFMGRRYSEDAVQENIHRARILYEVMESRSRGGGIDVVVGGTHLTPQQVSAKILQKLRDDAKAALRKQGMNDAASAEITDAVITVPAYFNDAQRQATRDAGKIAGLHVLQVLNEPTSACLAFGYNRLKEPRHTVAVFDLGGGTFDISIVEMGQGPFWVRATNGNTFLGGSDLDWMIVDWILSKLPGSLQQPARQDVLCLAHLRAAAEQAKITLSGEPVVGFGVITVTEIGPAGTGEPEDGGARAVEIRLDSSLSPIFSGCEQTITLSEAELAMIAAPWIEETLKPCARALSDAHLQPSEVQEVLLVGGQTKMPAIRRAVREFFGREPNTSVEPQEVVALGAAVQAAILSRQTTGLKLADVVPLSLGVRTRGGYMDVLIPRNARVPTDEVARPYTTTQDDQDTVEVHIYQGERPMVADNIHLGNFAITGIDLAKAGVPEIEVIFKVDDNGILHVQGRDVNNPETKKALVITESTRLSDEQVDAIIREAQENAPADIERRRKAEVQAQVEQRLTRLAIILRERGEQLDPALADEIRAALANRDNPSSEGQAEALETLLRKASGRG